MTAVRRAFLLGWRLHRAELAAVTIASAAISLVWLRTAAELDAVHGACLRIGPSVAPCGGLRESGQYFVGASQDLILMVAPFAAALPFAAGVVLGAPLLSRELEHRTAHIGWSLARTRARWLGLRLVPVLVIGLLLLVPVALAGEVLARSLYPLTDAGENFERYGVRGPLLLLRFIPALALAALAGLLVGRQLPALLVAGALVAALGAGLTWLRPFGATPVERAPSERPADWLGSLYVGVVYRDADGNLLREEEAWALMVVAEGEEMDEARFPRETFLVIPGERLPEVMTREAGVIGVTSVALAGALAAATRRRRPP